jgi:N-acylneuraminate cytidylyltransferase
MPTTEQFLGQTPYLACAVIVARGGSKRLVHKNLRKVGGKPLIQRAIEACREAGGIVGTVAVTTDSEEIAALARSLQAQVVDRPAELAGDTARIDEGAAHAVSMLFAGKPMPEITAIIQPNIPIWKRGTLRDALELMVKTKATGVVTGHAVHERPEWMLRKSEDGFANRFLDSVEAVAVNSQQLRQDLVHVDGQVVAVKTQRLLGNYPRTYLGPAWPRIAVLERDPVYGTDVDTPWQLVGCNAIATEMEQEASS